MRGEQDDGSASRRFWDGAARRNAAWYIATNYTDESEAFFEQGATEADSYLAHFRATARPGDTVLEIGCGVGRLTHRLGELVPDGHVVAADVSTEMLSRCRTNLADAKNISLLLLPGDGTLPLVDRSIDLVFSYITLQHVPTRVAQLRYLAEACRVLAPDGRLLIQIRGTSRRAKMLDWAGHLGHVTRGKRTLGRGWRGKRLSDDQVNGAIQVGVETSILVFNERHRWVVGRRTDRANTLDQAPLDA